MQRATATELTKNFGRYREIVQREPVAVTSHGRPTAYLVSVSEYEDLQRYRRLAHGSFATVDLERSDVEAIAKGKMASEHDHLDDLLDQT